MIFSNSFKILKQEDQQIWDLEEVKNFLRISHTYDDKMINSILLSAISSAEFFLGISLTNKLINAEFYAPKFYASKRSINLRYTPIIKINGIKVKKQKNRKEFRELGSGKYQLCKYEGLLQIDEEIYQDEVLMITYLAGYDPALIPEPVKLGILQHAAQMYDRSEYSSNLTPEISNLYLPYRKIKI